MLTRFKEDTELAVKAYNAGPNYVSKILAKIYRNYPEETIDYSKRIGDHYQFNQRIVYGLEATHQNNFHQGLIGSVQLVHLDASLGEPQQNPQLVWAACVVHLTQIQLHWENVSSPFEAYLEPGNF